MHNNILRPAAAVLMTLVLVGIAVAQPPDRRGPPGGGRGGRGGPGPGGGALEATLDDLKLSSQKRETAGEAVRAYMDSGRRLMDLADAELLLKLKEILSPEEYTKLKETTNRSRRGPGGPGRGLSGDDILERIMSFDKNKDGKITIDELPERMQNLIAKGDTNKDGSLDREEIKKLAADLAKDGSFAAGGPGGRGGRGGRGGPGGPAAGLPPGAIERAVDDLKLSEKKKETAAVAVKAHQENMRKLTDLARADLLLTISDVLGEEELKKFKTTLERQPGFGERPAGRPGRGG